MARITTGFLGELDKLILDGNYDVARCLIHELSASIEVHGKLAPSLIPIVTARVEIAHEQFRNAVNEEKIRLAKKPWWMRIFPYKITITRR